MSLTNLSYSIKLSILHDISEGMFYLHHQTPPIVHCDISPCHVLFTKSLCAKISAFNFCTFMGGTETSTKKPYVSPTQQLFNPPEINDAVTPKFDIYSFGMMCVYMLLGSDRIQEKAYNNSVTFDLSEIDTNFRQLIETCLSFDRNARLSSDVVARQMKNFSVQAPRRLKDIIDAINPTSDIEVCIIIILKKPAETIYWMQVATKTSLLVTLWSHAAVWQPLGWPQMKPWGTTNWGFIPSPQVVQ